MTDTQIDAFLAVVQFGSFTKAAESLFISEPALSRSILLLEKELGCTLIERKRGGRLQALTPAGKQFVQIADRWKILVTESKKLTDSEDADLLRIAAVESFNSYVLPSVYRQCMERKPELHLLIDTLHTQEIYKQIAHGLYDLAFVSSTSDAKNLEFTDIFHEKVVLICPAGMLPSGPVHPTQLDPQQEILSVWAADYQAWGQFWFGSDSRSRLYLRTLNKIEQFILHFKMWAFMPVSIAHSLAGQFPIELHEITSGPPDRICYAVQNRTFHHSASEELIDLVRESVKDMDGIRLSS